MSHCNKFTPSGARLMQQVDICVFMSTHGVWEAQETLSKQRLHKSGPNVGYSLVYFKGFMIAKNLVY